ncbi:MAG: rubredoxin [Gammaproteobacteria bacterium]
MTDRFFTGNDGIDASRLSPATKMECKICWHVYDPSEGDEVWQIPPGTAFNDLPPHWSCPQCGAPKNDFLVLEG